MQFQNYAVLPSQQEESYMSTRHAPWCAFHPAAARAVVVFLLGCLFSVSLCVCIVLIGVVCRHQLQPSEVNRLRKQEDVVKDP